MHTRRMKTSAQVHWESRGGVTVQRPEAPRSTEVTERWQGGWYDRPGEGLLTAKMLLEMRRKIRIEANDLRAYAEHTTDDLTRRVCNATADRLDDIIGGAPV